MTERTRFADISDAKAICDIYKYYAINTAVTFEYDAPDENEFARRITETNKCYPYLVYEENERVTGYAYASAARSRAAYQWTCELSVYVNRDARARGIGRALYERLLEILKSQNIRIAYACITYPNDESVLFHEKLGFRSVAIFANSGYKLGKWHDVLWMEKVLAPFDSPPPPFLPFRHG